MKIIENSKVKEKLYIEKMKNGLTVMIIPKPGIQKKYMIWGTNYGSNDNKFIVPGETEITEVPNGVAHFLEHKLFEQPNGTNSLDTLTALGVNANAFTTNDHTAYLFECTNNFYPAMDELMDYVQHPYFTDENVEKEKGIIGQEIKMYDDYPDWKVYLNALKILYHENPMKIDVAGTVETISHIDKEILYKCYKTFYHPSNMIMVIVGDFKPEEMFEKVRKRLVEQETKGEIKRINPIEPEDIVKPRIEEKAEVSMPLYTIGIKDNPKEDDKKKIVRKDIGIEIILNLILGKSSKLYQELYKDGIIFGEQGLSYEYGREYAHVLVTGQTTDPDKVYEGFKKEIRNMKTNGINKEDAERLKKMIYGRYIREYNDVSEIARMFLTDYLRGICSFDYLEEIEGIDVEYLEQLLKDVFNEDKMVISIVKN